MDLNTFTKVGALTLSDGEGYPRDSVIDTNRQLAYFGAGNLTPTVVKIDLTSFSRLASIQLLDGEDSFDSAVLDPLNDYMYI